jgi:hypothetical protein
VSKYHEGTFLGSPIKVEISHGGSRPRHVAVSNNPEACYTCGIIGHWARDCPKADSQIYSKRCAPLTHVRAEFNLGTKVPCGSWLLLLLLLPAYISMHLLIISGGPSSDALLYLLLQTQSIASSLSLPSSTS